MRIRIRDILSSDFVSSDSDFEPNYIVTESQRKVHRVKIVGTVREEPIVGSDGSYARFPLDDSTGIIWVSGFRSRVETIQGLAMGDMIQLVATVNEYREALELIAESIWRTGPNFWLLHRAEVLRTHLAARSELERSLEIHRQNVAEARDTARDIGMEPDVPVKEAEEEEDISQEVLDLVGELDDGSGAPLEEIVDGLKGSHSTQEIEGQLIKLMEEGEIYEPTVGRYARI